MKIKELLKKLFIIPRTKEYSKAVKNIFEDIDDTNGWYR